MKRSFRPGLLLVLGAFALPGSRLAAQSILVAPVDGRMAPVVRMQDARPIVSVDGKLASGDAGRLALVKRGEYEPVVVAVTDFSLRGSGKGWQGHAINHELHVYGTFTAPDRLEDAFFVLELNTRREGKLLFAYEIGTLAPHEPQSVSLTVPLSDALGGGKFVLHVFAGGRECLNTRMPPGERDAALDRIVAARIASVRDANPVLFLGQAPDYPKKLLKSKRTGRAVVLLHITPRGRVRDPQLKEATDPAFGEAALAAVADWHFLPKVHDGHPVGSEVTVPFDFAPPGAKSPRG